MTNNIDRASAATGQSEEAAAMPIDQLAEDLRALVDQLEADCNEQRILSWNAADRLHELRQRAERLFGDMGQAR